ncbi:MAG TPA: NaeI family type II restriction endonuclease [Solirubrobacteraceae bacterium]|nr:NaeI family type II restriction endonuclease [Solirubrobacteraceae bacterium]
MCHADTLPTPSQPRRPPVRRAGPTEPHRLLGFDPPALGADPELDAVSNALQRADQEGEMFAGVLRETYDQLYDGQRTGRYCSEQLRKTEKTYMGTLVEINLHRAFKFEDGVKMDYLIDGVDTDCKFSQKLGGWEIPPEAYEGKHVCLVVWASDQESRWEAGVIRVSDDPWLLGPENRDRKRKLTPAGESTIRWLYSRPALPENLLLHIPPLLREKIFNPDPSASRRSSGQSRINMLFRLIQGRLVNRASVLTVAQQKDSLKRPRDARLPEHLGKEGILVLGHQEHDPLIAEDLGLPRPPKGSFISVRVIEAEDGYPGMTAEIAGQRYRLATDSDPARGAPELPRGTSASGEDE